MTNPSPFRRVYVLSVLALLLVVSSQRADAQAVTVTVQANAPGIKMDPIFYGLMTEEINYSYDGGLYAELIQNRTFQDTPPPGRGGRGNRGRGAATQPGAAEATPPPAPPPPNFLQHWSLVNSDGAAGAIEVDQTAGVNMFALRQSLKLDITTIAAAQRVGVANDGFWGIPVKPNTEYKATFLARLSNGFNGPLTASIESPDGKTTYATATIPTTGGAWQKYSATLKTGTVPPTANARFVISANQRGTVWLNLVSLFPPTYKNRANGMRSDLMELLAGLKPKFLRFPGGNYLEGSNYENRWNWKATIGPLEDRPGHWSPWRYRSSDGVGMLEFLHWCEDLGMEPIVGIYSGLHLDGGGSVITGEALKPHIQDALDEIEYITGDTNTKWGAVRAQHGHPSPFKLNYVEIGNEEFLNNGGATYKERFTRFYDAIKGKYPSIKVMSSMQSRNNYDHGAKPDLVDDHDYMQIPVALNNVHRYDTYPRDGVKIFAGEWATNNPRVGNTPMMAFALADAAWLTGLERNCDVVIMHCYAPLLVNVNPGGQQWAVNLIGYDAIGSFGSPSYYVQKMFSNHRGDTVVPTKIDGLPMLPPDQIPVAPVPEGARGGGGGGRGGRGPQGPFDGIYAVTNRDSASGDLILKLVNIQNKPQALNIDIQGVATIRPQATGEMLTGELGAINTVAEPTKVIPKAISINNAAPKFAYELPAHSVSVIRLKTK